MYKRSPIKKACRVALQRSKKFYRWLENQTAENTIKNNSLMEVEKPKDRNNHKLIFCVNPGRSGTRWLSKIFDAHENWIGTCERFGQYESFIRYCTWYNLGVDLEGVFKLLEQAIYHDFKNHKNSMIVSPFFNFIIPKMVERYKPDYVFFVYRDPIETVCSMHERGFYKEKIFTSNNKLDKAPINILAATKNRLLSETFSRILPKKDFSLKEWENLTRIGKCTWFWVTQMKALQKAHSKIKGVKRKVYVLKDIDQNYSFYEQLSKEHNLRPKLSKGEFLSLKKITHPETENIHSYSNWSRKEKEEFWEIIKEAKLKEPFKFSHKELT